MLTKAQLSSIFPKAVDSDLQAFISFGEQALRESGICLLYTSDAADE